MEYLPKDSNLEVTTYMEKKEEKLREFRQYLVDKQVVLSITKCILPLCYPTVTIVILALRNAESKPSDPTTYLQEYFGKYRDPAWDEVDRLKAENKKLAEETVPAIQAKIKDLEKNVQRAKVDQRIRQIFEKLEKDKTVPILHAKIVGMHAVQDAVQRAVRGGQV